MMSRACVTGLGVVSALGRGVAATVARLGEGRCGACSLDEHASTLGIAARGHPVAELDADALQVSRAQLRYMSPAMRHLQAAALEALAEARLTGDRQYLPTFGVAIGAHTGERRTRDELQALQRGIDPTSGRINPAGYAEALLARSPLSALRAQPGLLAGVLSQLHGTQGPCLTFIDAGVAGGLAVAEACEGIAAGWCDRWIAGGTFDLDDPWILLSPRRGGPSAGSAAAVLILESEDSVERRRAPVLADVQVEDDLDLRDVGTDAFDTAPFEQQLGNTHAAALPVALVLAIHQRWQAAIPTLGDAGPAARVRVRLASDGTCFAVAVRRAPSARSLPLSAHSSEPRSPRRALVGD